MSIGLILVILLVIFLLGGFMAGFGGYGVRSQRYGDNRRHPGRRRGVASLGPALI